MARKKVPGQTSLFALLCSSFWTILGLFIIIIGHLIIVFYAFGKLTATDALSDLADFLPFLEPEYFYLVAGLAIILDVWIVISKKIAYKKQFER